MITTETFAKVEKELNQIFPDAKIKNSFTPNGMQLAFTTPLIGTMQLHLLSPLVRRNEVQIEIKRSGTGMSVKIG